MKKIVWSLLAGLLLSLAAACGSDQTVERVNVTSSTEAASQPANTPEKLTVDKENQSTHQTAEDPAFADYLWLTHEFQNQMDGNPLHYRLYVPETEEGKTYPIVLVLHGSGGLGSDNTTHLGPLNGAYSSAAWQEKNPCYVLAVQMPAEAADFYEEEARYLREYDKVILEVMAAYGNIDPSRIYVTGHSLGGAYTLNLMELNPKRYAGGLVLSGCSVHSTWGFQIDISRLKDSNIYMLHGTKDAWILPEEAYRTYHQLKETGGTSLTLEFISMKGLEEKGLSDQVVPDFPAAGAAGHMTANIAVSENGTAWMDWLFSQELGKHTTDNPEIIYWTDAENEILTAGWDMERTDISLKLTGSNSGSGTSYLASGRVAAPNDLKMDDKEVVLKPGDVIYVTLKGYSGGDRQYGLEKFQEMWDMEYQIQEGSIASIEISDEDVVGLARDGVPVCVNGQVYLKIALSDSFEGENVCVNLTFTTKQGYSYLQQIRVPVKK